MKWTAIFRICLSSCFLQIKQTLNLIMIVFEIIYMKECLFSYNREQMSDCESRLKLQKHLVKLHILQ